MKEILRSLSALLGFLSVVAVATLPLGSVANAASNKATCQPGEGANYCNLEISAPGSVPVGQPFTVKVAIMNGFEGGVVAKSDFCASKAMVALDLYEGESYVTTFFAKASGGIATFTISVSSPDSYSLDAYVDLGESYTDACGNHYFDGFADFTAVDVLPGQPIYPCPDNVSCDQTTSGSGSAATLFANDGTFEASFGPRESLCGDGGPLDPNGVLTFSYIGGTSSKTIVFALSPSLVTKGIGQFNICWQSDNPFTPLGGGPQVTVGYLPDCGKNATGPCVLFRTSTQYNGAFFGVLAPPSDPKGYPW